MKKIVVVGSINMDISLKVNHIPQVGETIIADELMKSGGGKGANQAVAMARLGADVTFIGRVGDDDDGKELLNSLEKFGVKLDGVIKDKTINTGSAYISVSHAGENNIVVFPGANFTIDKNQIDSFSSLISNADYCVMQMEIPLEIIEYTIALCRKNHVCIILNPAPAKKITDEMLQGVDYVIPNETELQLLSEEKGTYEEMAYNICKKGVKNIIVTLGEKGCLLVNQQQRTIFPPVKVKATDTTAAGDSFIGGFVTSLAEGNHMEEAIKFATNVAAMTVMTQGAQNSLPNRCDVELFIEKNNSYCKWEGME